MRERPPRFSALVLAAGKSERMGTPKAWLRLEGKSLLERVVGESVAAGAHQVVVVVGAEKGSRVVSREELERRSASRPELRSRLRIVIGNPEGHPIDSIRAGLTLVPSGDNVLLWPVDHPFADAALVRALASALGSQKGRIVVPLAERKHAHPILLANDVARELLTPIADDGAHQVVHRDPRRIIEAPAADARIAMDVDTPEDAARLGLEISS